MIKDLELLIPMLENLADGALFGFLAYLVVSLLSATIWPIALTVVTLYGGKLAVQMHKTAYAPEGVGKLDIYEASYNGRRLCYLGDKEPLMQLLAMIKRSSAYDPDGNYIHTGDMQKLIIDMKKMGYKDHD